MFYYLEGTLALLQNNIAVIDCGGVGYKLTVSRYTLALLENKAGQKVKLYTHLAIRENDIELFGFGSTEEKACFNQLIGVSGVGPKVALAVLSSLSPDRFSYAVCTEDVKTIAKAQGVGAKTAARIVLELKDKVSKDMLTASPDLGEPAPGKKAPQMSGRLSEATEALMVLGYDKNSVLDALRGIDTATTETGEIIRLALRRLSR